MSAEVELAPLSARVDLLGGVVTVIYEVKLSTSTVSGLAVARGETSLNSPSVQDAIAVLRDAIVSEMHTSVGLAVEDDWLTEPENPDAEEEPL